MARIVGCHQRAAPLRRRAREMRDAVFGETREMIGDRLAGAGENQRRAAAHRAEIDLQAAVAADVVERAPNVGAVGRARGAHGGGEPFEIVHDHLRHAGRARGHQHPFGVQRAPARLRASAQSPARKSRAAEARARRAAACRHRSRRRRCRRGRSRLTDARPRRRAAGSRCGGRRRQARSAPARW